MASSPSGWPNGAGMMAERIRAHDWAGTPLGPSDGWPPTLRTSVDLILACGCPMQVLWGRELLQIHNDAYAGLVGPERAMALGEAVDSLWPEAAEARAYDRVLAGATVTVATSVPARHREDPGGPPVALSLTPLVDSSGAVAGVLVAALDEPRRQLEAAAQRERQLVLELQHRVRNLLGVLRSIVRRSAGASTTLQDFTSHLDGRIAALSRTESLLATGAERVSLEAAAYEELRAQLAYDQASVAGPEVELPPRHAQVIALALHELAVNSVKYGALATRLGRIDLNWTIDAGREPWLTLTWRERNVRIAAAPTRQGFGMELIERQIPYELDGDSLIQFHPDGVEATIRFPLPPPGLRLNAPHRP